MIKKTKKSKNNLSATTNDLTLQNIEKFYDGKHILKKINLKIKANSFTTLLGPSGCGKTTILRLIAGFESPDFGEIKLGDTILNKIPAHKRPFNTVFQNYSLFPHMNVFSNVAYSLTLQKISKKESVTRVNEILKLVGLESKIHNKVDSLSGGEKQRVAIARSLVNKPQILLLDEPLSALDSKLRKFMQQELKRIQRETNVTFIFVTHDQEEALTMSDYLFVLNDGKIQHQGDPINIYNEPINSWVAGFIGASNIIYNATFIKDKLIKFDSQEFKCVDVGFKPNSKVDVVFRPEDLVITEKNKGLVNGKIKSQLFKGIHWETVVTTKQRDYVVDTIKKHTINEQVALTWDPEDIHVMEIKDAGKKVTLS